MAKESFNWKSIFINDPQENIPKETEPTSSQFSDNKFPDQATNIVASSTNPYMEEVYKTYDKGFDSLNSEGFDFFELYKSVMAVGPTNPQSYQMAYAMGKTINSGLTKDFLLEKAQYYISEIEKVYTKYDTTGNSKKKDLNDSINKEKDTLSKSIVDLEAKIILMQREVEAKKAEFKKVDPQSIAELNEIQLKIEANNLAKHKILDSINTVVTGINQYLQ
ncbi:hypothetical protein [Flavobacterium sp.]|uniref:hypothetical protein n=1 Tax=Flavobacterium sp. TaxID=239 RepID=UPI00286A89E3|nr:hypothetical protein [Flavobacterium sp.]